MRAIMLAATLALLLLSKHLPAGLPASISLDLALLLPAGAAMPGSADVQFALLALLQGLYGDSYNIALAALLGKLVLLAAVYLLCREVVAQARMPRWMLAAMFLVALLLLARAGHLALFQGFDPAQTAVLATISGMAVYLLDHRRRGAWLWLLMLTLACVGPQYSFLPALAGVSLFLVSRLAMLPIPTGWLRALSLAQLLALLPLCLVVLPVLEPRLMSASLQTHAASAAGGSAAVLAMVGLDAHIASLSDLLRPWALLLGLLVPLTLRLRRLYVRLV
ncbi:hypothetical protein, partial [Chitinimonas sp.]|uniref:hypothetical protein n=1 Tax=Chitinimonas sp. TaxID=1934313 RepID=UPI0035AF5297